MFNTVHKIKKLVKNPDGSSYWYEDTIEELLRKIPEPTGRYDRTGKAIFDGDRIRGTFISTIVKGYVKKIDGEWFLIVDEADFVKDNFIIELRYVQSLYLLESDPE